MELNNKLHTSAANPLYPFSSTLDGPQSQSGRFGEEKNSLPYRESILRRKGEAPNVFIHLAHSFLTSTVHAHTLFTNTVHAHTLFTSTVHAHTLFTSTVHARTLFTSTVHARTNNFFQKRIINFYRYAQSDPAGKRAFGELFCTKSHFQLLCLVP